MIGLDHRAEVPRTSPGAGLGGNGSLRGQRGVPARPAHDRRIRVRHTESRAGDLVAEDGRVVSGPFPHGCGAGDFCVADLFGRGVKKLDSAGRRAGDHGRAGSDCASCRRVCCTGSCVPSFACSPAAAVSGSSRSWSCATSWRSSDEEGSGRDTRPPTERCSPRQAACFRPSGGPALRWARRRFAAGTGHCCREEVGDAAAAGPVVRRLRPRRAA